MGCMPLHGPGLCAYYVCMRAAQMPSLAALYVRPGQVWAVGHLGRSLQCEGGGGGGAYTNTK